MNQAALIDSATLARVESLAVQSRNLAQSMLHGIHRSRKRGVSVEFVEHKDYTPGDDIRFIDWKVWARRDRASVKRFEEETNLRAMLAIDCSASMTYRGPDSIRSKWEYAQLLAATLSYLLLHQRDAVGVDFLGTKELLPARSERGHFQTIVHELSLAATVKNVDFPEVLGRLGERLSRPHMVIILTDLLGDRSRLQRSLRALVGARHEVRLLHILDPAELTFPFSEAMRFEDLETDIKVQVSPADLRVLYQEEIRRYQEEIRTLCLSENIDYETTSTAEPPADCLLRFLRRQGR